MRTLIRGFVVVALLAGACGGGGDVGIDDVWARNSAGTQNAGAVYMTITGGEVADRLIAASVPPEVAAVAEIHETAMADDDSGMMTMQQVAAIDVPSGDEVELQPGGFHVMLTNLAEPLQVGDTFDLTLTFEDAGDMVVSVDVREN